MPSRSTLAQLLQTVVTPSDPERLRLNQRRWRELPAELRVRQQAMGRRLVACGATHSIMERCNFACTSCYLTEVANARCQPCPSTRSRCSSMPCAAPSVRRARPRSPPAR